MSKMFLGDVCLPESSNIAQKDLTDKDGQYPIYGASGLISRVNFYRQECEYIAVVKDGAGIGRVFLLPPYSSVIGTMQYILPKPNIDVHYLYFSMQFMNLAKYYSGSTIPHIYFKNYKHEPIKLPPLEKQREIAATLETIKQAEDNLNEQIMRLDELVKSRFVEMFGDPVTNPMGWDIQKLSDLSHKISDGVHAKPNYTQSGKPFISVVNINKGILDFKECKYVSEEDYLKMIKSTRPEKGDVLYTKVGATYGIPTYVATDKDFCLYVSVCLIKPMHEVIDAEFLTESMRLPYVKHQADRRIRGIGVPDLHLNQIREFQILTPPLNRQKEFVDFIHQVDKSKLVLRQLLEKQQTLKAALMQEYFAAH